MNRIRTTVGLLVIALLLAACQSATPTVGSIPETTAYPPVQQNPPEGNDYPQPSFDPVDMSGAYPLLPGDEDKAAGNFFPDLFELRANPNDPTKTDLFTAGSLPTPCNEIRAIVTPPDANQQINVQVYSVAEKDRVCTQVLQPFEGVIATISDFPAGTYQVYANSQLVGEVMIP